MRSTERSGIYLASFFAVMIFVTFTLNFLKIRLFNLKTAKNAEFSHYLAYDFSTMDTRYKEKTEG